MKKFLSYFIFLIIIAGDLAGQWGQLKSLDYIFKPLIMVWIAGYFVLNATQIDKKVVQLALSAFLFSWLGDLFLMFGDKKFLFFMLGLLSFLAAQIVYIYLFLLTIRLSGKRSFLKKEPYWLIAYIAFGLIFYIVLFEHLDAVLKIGVMAYLVALLGMSVMALNRFGNGHPVSFSLVFTGSLLFIVSDSLIALNKFVVAIPYEGILIMATYIGAQYLIMRGLLIQYE
jgi:uncharacterized membrane protein YhhN